MKKEKVFHRLEAAWLAFTGSYSGLSRGQLTVPGVSGEWSVKEIISHVSWWEEEAIKHIPMILEGRRPQRYSVLYGGIDAFNSKMAEQKRSLSLARVLKDQEETHRRLIEYLHTVPENQFATETRFLRRLRLDTYGHYAIHARAIEEWKKKSGLE